MRGARQRSPRRHRSLRRRREARVAATTGRRDDAELDHDHDHDRVIPDADCYDVSDDQIISIMPA